MTWQTRQGAIPDREGASPFYAAGRNCWRVEKLQRAAVIVDGANYYRALYQAITRAKSSIFILGWDIDSRIRLLRGSEARPGMPVTLFDLICWKARQNQNLAIYLNRWSYTLYQAAEREGFSALRWKLLAPKNVHFLLDGHHPFGGCHHQKIVVIDDELAFSGGMDVALERWDRRSHHPESQERTDPGGTYAPHTRHKFRPHHDVMLMLSGPAARALGELARWRWSEATGKEPVISEDVVAAGASAWPPEIEPQFGPAEIAIARTIPPLKGKDGIYEIEELLIDKIEEARHFIYIENQYLTSSEIARALNRQLRTHKSLRLLLVSCMEPQGIMERKAMWGGRLNFQDLLKAGNVGERIVIAYPASREKGREDAVRVHSKVMIIDDRFLHIGSANFNNRSLRFDTECDLSIKGDTPTLRTEIAARRDDLIAEHSGLSLEEVRRLIEQGEVKLFLRCEEGTHFLRPIDDEPYRDERLIKLSMRLADPAASFLRRNQYLLQKPIIGCA